VGARRCRRTAQPRVCLQPIVQQRTGKVSGAGDSDAIGSDQRGRPPRALDTAACRCAGQYRWQADSPPALKDTAATGPPQLAPLPACLSAWPLTCCAASAVAAQGGRRAAVAGLALAKARAAAQAAAGAPACARLPPPACCSLHRTVCCHALSHAVAADPGWVHVPTHFTSVHWPHLPLLVPRRRCSRRSCCPFLPFTSLRWGRSQRRSERWKTG
jgi:hypothetical protein